MIEHRTFNEEVLYAEGNIVTVCVCDIDCLKRLSHKNKRRRIRLCSHNDIDDALHEMLIVHDRNAYVRPHKHPGKSESFHIIEGRADVVLFDDSGGIREIISMGDYKSGLDFYYRLRSPFYHTLLIKSELLVFHEITNGPFDRDDMVFANWSPEEDDTQRVEQYKVNVHRAMEIYMSNSSTHNENEGN
jgi:cupin fold WbuC family metalloprotein